MRTIIKKINKNQVNTDVIREAGRILKEGGLVAFPTETVYGLGADALNEDAAKKIYAAKGRPSDNPLIIHITNMEALDRITVSISEKARIVAKHYWPGPLTMIFDKSDIVPYGTTGGLNTVAVRMPVHEIAKEVIDAVIKIIRVAPDNNGQFIYGCEFAGMTETDILKIDIYQMFNE